MKKYAILSVGVIVLGWISFAALVGIDTADAVAYNKVDRHLGTATFRAGDLVSVSPDGTRIDYLCNMSVAEEDLKAARVRKSYRNWLDESLPAFAQFAAWTRSTIGLGDGGNDAPVSLSKSVDFDGRVLSLPIANQRPMMQGECVCAVAEMLVKRHSICMVSKSMNEFVMTPDADGTPRVSERTVGATFRDNPLWIPDVQALGCDNISSAASIPEKSESICPGPETLNNVWLRSKLRVIREYELETQSAALNGRG